MRCGVFRDGPGDSSLALRMTDERGGSMTSALNELSTTPDNPNGEPCFTIIHPFHPLYGHTFPLLSQHLAWGEERVLLTLWTQ